MYVEKFIKALRKVLWQKKCRIGIKLPARAFKIPFLLFVDDSLLFYKINLKSCQELSSILNKFCQIFEPLIIFHKPSLTFSSYATTHHKHSMSYVFSIMHQDNVGKYLGCQVFTDRLTAKTFHVEWAEILENCKLET